MQGRNVTISNAAWKESDEMGKRNTRTTPLPKFANEGEEATWWASEEGRQFLKVESVRPRLPSPDLAKAREIAERTGIGCQTLLKMIVHEGLEREERQGD